MSKILLSHRLKHRVTIEEVTRIADGQGGFTESWSEVDTVWAEVVPFSSRSTTQERLVAEKLETQGRYRITIRYREGVDSAMRIMFGTREFNILSVVNVGERGAVLELFCMEE